jgi:hypothetical protein
VRRAVVLAVLAAGCHHPSAGAPDAAADATIEGAPDADQGHADCGSPIPCGAAAPGKVNVCGALFGLADNQALIDPALPLSCDPLHPTGTGPCSVRLAVYDAIAYLTAPATAVPLVADEVLVNGCGQFRVKNADPVGAQGLALVVTDAGAGTYEPTMSAVATTPATHTSVRLYALDAATDAAWMTSAGLTGPGFAARGVLFALFLHQSAPVAGVRLIVDGHPDPADDFYFSDGAPASRTTIDPAQDVTGADGAALLVGPAGVTPTSGTGAEPVGCRWPPPTGMILAGVATVQPYVAVQTAAPSMLCP